MMHDPAALTDLARRYEAVLSRDPAAYSFAPLADVYRELGRLEDALDTARRGCTRYPEFAAGHLALAKASLAASRQSEAMTALENVVRITPENIAAQRLLAEMYAVAGNQAGADRCLAIADSLDPEALPPDMEPATTATDVEVEELLDADVLELTDDLVEEVEEEPAVNPFAALPDRPSLGDAVRAVPFMIDTPPPIHKEEAVPAEPAPPVASATIAELYVSQGFPDKGQDVYRQLLAAEPDNVSYQRRLAELAGSGDGQQPVAPAVPTASPGSAAEVVETLTGWLGNIGRARECRTKSL